MTTDATPDELGWPHLWKGVTNIAGLTLPSTTTERLDAVDQRLNIEPLPVALAHLLRSDVNKPDWLARLRWCIADFRDGLAATYYHLENTYRIELQAARFAAAHLPNPDMIRGTTGGGDTRRIDAEFHAFVFAGRRTMEYFANAVSAFFKMRTSSIRDLPGLLKKASPQEVAVRVNQLLRPESLDLFVSKDGKEGDKKSLRDRLAHEAWVTSGSLNIIKGPQGGVAIVMFGSIEGRNPADIPALAAPFVARPGQILVTSDIGNFARRSWEQAEKQMFDVLLGLFEDVQV